MKEEKKKSKRKKGSSYHENIWTILERWLDILTTVLNLRAKEETLPLFSSSFSLFLLANFYVFFLYLKLKKKELSEVLKKV